MVGKLLHSNGKNAHFNNLIYGLSIASLDLYHYTLLTGDFRTYDSILRVDLLVRYKYSLLTYFI